MINKPLVSFCLMACRQEKYIAEALNFVLAQDYENLEVVVSDDGSTDGTWDIVQKIASQYRGPHKIILNRNCPNLGTMGNWEKLCELSHGEILIKADGDDEQYPNKASAIVEAWMNSGGRAMIMTSSYDVMNEKGRVIDERIMPSGNGRSVEEIVQGYGFFCFGIACHRSLFDSFPRVTYMGSSDNSVYEARALLKANASTALHDENTFESGICVIKEKLFCYRLGSGDTTGGQYRKFMITGARRVLAARQQTLLDIDSVKACLPFDLVEKLSRIYSEQIEHQRNVLALYTGKSFRERLRGYRQIASQFQAISSARIAAWIFLLPSSLGDIAFSLIQKFNKLRR